MAKVFVITVGDYSDLWVHSVHSTEEGATRMCDLLTKAYSDSIDIIEVALDPVSALSPDRLPMSVSINARGVAVSKAYSVPAPDGEDTGLEPFINNEIVVWESDGKDTYSPEMRARYPRLPPPRPAGVYEWSVKVMAKDEEHARKIAGEKYAQWLAEREGIA